MAPVPESGTPVTRSELVDALRRAGLASGETLMTHTRMSALGLVIGGADSVVSALLEALGPHGALVAYTSWEHDAYEIAEWSEQRQAAYRADPPVFDPRLSESWTGVGRIPERLRTWPGAHRSAHPLASIAALGREAADLVRDHALDDGYGASSPLAKLVARRGRVLLLGAPLETLTILHHAEAIASLPGKRYHACPARVRTPAGVIDTVVVDIDTSNGAFDYSTVTPPGADAFAVIAAAALASGVGRSVSIAGAPSHLFDAAELVAFALTWLERNVPRPTAADR